MFKEPLGKQSHLIFARFAKRIIQRVSWRLSAATFHSELEPTELKRVHGLRCTRGDR